MNLDPFIHALFGTSTIPTSLIVWWWAVGPDGRRKARIWLRKRFMPNTIRAAHRAGIRQAQATLRLIEGTHFFEHNLDATVRGFIPPEADGPYWDAFRRTYTDKAHRLHHAQTMWDALGNYVGPKFRL